MYQPAAMGNGRLFATPSTLDPQEDQRMSTPWSTLFWIGGCVAAWLLCAVAPVPADTIFTWTDDRGFRHFSDTPPPEATGEPIKVAPPPSAPEADPRRPAYDQMVEEYRRETDEMERTRKLEAEKAAAQKEQERRSRRDEKVRSEKKRLADQIQQLRQRAPSPTYPAGMRSAQIRAIEKRLEELHQDPEAYFRGTE
jgi:type IV secretory pathway VirB10-like protein